MKIFGKRFARGMATIAAGALCTLPLAACGSSNAKGGDNVSISFYSYFKKDQIGKVIEEFEKQNPQIKIDAQYAQSSDDFIQTLQTRLAGGEPPTVFNIIMDNRTDVIDANLALDLTGSDFFKGIDKENFSLFEKDGKTYAMPVTAWVGAMFYNTDLLKAAGVTETPKTWNDFIEVGKKVKATGKEAYLEDFNTQPSASIEGLLASRYDKQGINEKDEIVFSGKSTYAKEWTPVIEEWKKAIDAGVLPTKSAGISADQVKQEFISGNLAAMRSGPWDLEDVRKSGVKFEVGPMPAFEDGEPWIGGGPDQGFAVAAKAPKEKQEAGKKFLAFLNSKEGLKAFTDAAGTLSLSANYEAQPPAELAKVIDEYFKKNKFYWVNFAKSPAAMTQKMIASQQQVVQGKITPQQFGEEMDKAAAGK